LAINHSPISTYSSAIGECTIGYSNRLGTVHNTACSTGASDVGETAIHYYYIVVAINASTTVVKLAVGNINLIQSLLVIMIVIIIIVIIIAVCVDDGTCLGEQAKSTVVDIDIFLSSDCTPTPGISGVSVVIAQIRGIVPNEHTIPDSHIFHAIDYCGFTNTITIKETINDFKWTLSVHNTVRARIIIEKPTAVDDYTAGGISFNGCSLT
jgi:hypothetical protein